MYLGHLSDFYAAYREYLHSYPIMTHHEDFVMVFWEPLYNFNNHLYTMDNICTLNWYIYIVWTWTFMGIFYILYWNYTQLYTWMLFSSVLGFQGFLVCESFLSRWSRMNCINYSSNLQQAIRTREKTEHALFNLLHDYRMKIILLGIWKQPKRSLI